MQLSNTSIDDDRLKQIASLKKLTSLNLVGTGVTAQGLLALSNLKDLRNVYLYKTDIKPAERKQLNDNFRDVHIDYGNYTLPMLITDTTEIKYN